MIRLATQDDVQQIAEVHVQSWKETYTGLIHQHILDDLRVEKRVQLWQILVGDENHRIFVYENAGKVLGFIDGLLHPNKNIAEIKAFYLMKQIQGQGIGRELFEKFYQLIQPEQHQFLQLDVIKQNPSRYFYEKMGGQVIGEEVIPEYGEGVSDIFYQWRIA